MFFFVFFLKNSFNYVANLCVSMWPWQCWFIESLDKLSINKSWTCQHRWLHIEEEDWCIATRSHCRLCKSLWHLAKSRSVFLNTLMVCLKRLAHNPALLSMSRLVSFIVALVTVTGKGFHNTGIMRTMTESRMMHQMSLSEYTLTKALFCLLESSLMNLFALTDICRNFLKDLQLMVSSSTTNTHYPFFVFWCFISKYSDWILSLLCEHCCCWKSIVSNWRKNCSDSIPKSFKSATCS